MTKGEILKKNCYICVIWNKGFKNYMAILDFFKVSEPSAVAVPAEKVQKKYKSLRFQTFLAGTFGYALYYVCRLSMGVMKQPLIDAGLLNATQLGIIGACLYWAYACGKFVNGFLCDGSNIKRFMASGLIVSVAMNFIMGILGVSALKGGFFTSILFVSFAICWAINGWAQSMGAPPAIIGLSRWFPLKIRGTFYGFFSSSHNIGEGLSFVFVGMLVAAFGWKWGFFGAALAGALGVLIILFFLHDTPESKGLPPIEVLAGEMKEEEALSAEEKRRQTKLMQKAVIKNPGVWILALASAFMYMSRYAINEWGTIFLQEAKGYSLAEAATIIGINPIFGIIGTVVSGWLSDFVFKGDRKYPAFVSGILEAIALALFLFGGPAKWVNILAMVLFGIAIGVLISFLGGLMAVDLVPRQATGAALGIVGMASYAAAGLQNVVTGLLLDNHITAAGTHDYTYVSWFWLGAAIISFLLPVLNWRRKQQVI
jgi:OPA family sugar phosphate sensor protein UhpC-like MFS transporter